MVFLNHLRFLMTMEKRLSQGQNQGRNLLTLAWAGQSIHPSQSFLRSLIAKLLDLILLAHLLTVSKPHLKIQHSGSSMKDMNVSVLLENQDSLLQMLNISMCLWPVTLYFLSPLPTMMDSLDMVVVRWCNCLLEQQAT